MAGIRMLSSGDIAVAQPFENSVRMVSSDGSGTSAVLDVSMPRTLAAGSDDEVFVAEYAPPGRVLVFNPYTADPPAVIASDLTLPNGLTLSPDGRRLYVADADAIWTVDRDAAGLWGEIAPFMRLDGQFTTLTTDVCGNLYTVAYASGEVYRLSPDGATRELLVDLSTDGGLFSGIRFGNGVSGFERDTLYVTNRWGSLYGIALGVPGREPV
jgi:sugar lactone lactonase YvrE